MDDVVISFWYGCWVHWLHVYFMDVLWMFLFLCVLMVVLDMAIMFWYRHVYDMVMYVGLYRYVDGYVHVVDLYRCFDVYVWERFKSSTLLARVSK